jgi:hypothetical protein
MLQWTFHPFILQTKRFYTVLIWRRVLAFLCVSVSLLGTLLYVIIWCLLQFVTYTIVSLFLCVFFLQASQFLRIVTFYSTQLPGPNYHCREVRWFIRAIYIYLCYQNAWEKYVQKGRFWLTFVTLCYCSLMSICTYTQGSPLARLPPPKNAAEVFLINCKMQLSPFWTNNLTCWLFLSEYLTLMLLHDCSHQRCHLWMWWLDFFIAHDLHFGLHHNLPEIWECKVRF